MTPSLRTVAPLALLTLLSLLTACSSGPANSPARAVSALCEPGASLNAYSQRALLGVGYEALQSNNVACAERLLAEASRIDPKDPWALLNLGVARQRLGKLDAARQAYQMAAAQDPATSGLALSAQGKSVQEPEVAVAASSGAALKQTPGQIALQNLKLIR